MSTHLLTLQRLQEMMENLRTQYPISIFEKGADMSDATMKALRKLLRPDLVPPKGGDREWFESYKLQLMGVDIHIVPDIPFGQVEPCRCKEREFTESIERDMERARRIKENEDGL